MSVPSMRIEPWSGLSRPISVLRNTDLPVPDGPSITQISPAGTVSVTSPQISCLPKDLVSPLTWISTPTARPPSLDLGCPHSDQRPVSPPCRPRARTHSGVTTGPGAGGYGGVPGRAPPDVRVAESRCLQPEVRGPRPRPRVWVEDAVALATVRTQATTRDLRAAGQPLSATSRAASMISRPAAGVVVADGQRRDDVDPVVVDERDQPGGLARGGGRVHGRARAAVRRERLLGRAVADQLDRPEDTEAAHLADAGVVGGDLLQAGPEHLAPRRAAFSTMPSSSMVSIVATAAAQASGWPE